MKSDNFNNSETAILVGLINSSQSDTKVRDYLDELEFLAFTRGITTQKRITQHLPYPDPKFFVGKGKLQEIKEFVIQQKTGQVIFDDDLSPSQVRNIERELKCKIIDRSQLIIEIFAQRAKTARATLQVQLANYQYLMPRLTGMWTHLSKQKGGIGVRGGPGETEIETDRRVIRNKISLLKEKLSKIDKQRITQRKSRKSLVRVSLVGYTNVGKSTLMNLLAKTNILAEDKLFATLDPTVRKVVINNIPFLISDTVGFIRKLPHHLIESFKSTLDEIRDSDLLLHVVDFSHPSAEEQMTVVKQTLIEMGCGEKNVLTVYNKLDKWRERIVGEEKLTSEIQNTSESIYISATQKENIDTLKIILGKKIEEIYHANYNRLYFNGVSG